MIYINKNLKNGDIISEKTLPLLYNIYDDGTCERIGDFGWRWGNDYDIEIETTISDRKVLLNKIKLVLEQQRKNALELIKIGNEQLEAMNKMLDEVDYE